jgi:hypothetical protein
MMHEIDELMRSFARSEEKVAGHKKSGVFPQSNNC